MSKRGPKRYEDSEIKLVPLRIIADKLNCSERTINRDYTNAINKLKQIPGAFEILLANISR